MAHPISLVECPQATSSYLHSPYRETVWSIASKFKGVYKALATLYITWHTAKEATPWHNRFLLSEHFHGALMHFLMSDLKKECTFRPQQPA